MRRITIDANCSSKVPQTAAQPRRHKHVRKYQLKITEEIKRACRSQRIDHKCEGMYLEGLVTTYRHISGMLRRYFWPTPRTCSVNEQEFSSTLQATTSQNRFFNALSSRKHQLERWHPVQVGPWRISRVVHRLEQRMRGKEPQLTFDPAVLRHCAYRDPANLGRG